MMMTAARTDPTRDLRPKPLPRSGVRQRPTTAPTVSVVVTNYNYARFLPQSVCSALAQGEADTEVIIVDDVSTDDSLKVMRDLAAGDARVRLIESPINSGPVAAFNRGLAAATGAYVIRLDADDLLTPGSVARSTALAEQHPNVGFVYGHPVAFTDRPPVNHRDMARTWDVWTGTDWLELRCRLATNCITSPEVLMRRSTLDAVGGMRELAHTHDMELWMRLARAADVGWIGGCDQAWHRDHSASLSSREVGVMVDLHERADAFRVLFSDGQGEPAGDARLWLLARRSLANEALSRATSAIAKGRGGTQEIEDYRAFADTLKVDLDDLPVASHFRLACRLGPRRSRWSLRLVAWAALYRLTRELGAPRLRSEGI